MKKRWILPGLVAAAFALATTGVANSGHGQGHGKKKTKFGPYDVVTDDHGSCGPAHTWAVDTEKRTFKVKRNRDGSFRVTRTSRGTFVTLAGRSPGACQTKGKHGSTVLAGMTGKFHAYLRGTVTGGTFNPNATCPADCGFTDVWIATFFGPSAQFSCLGNSKDCKFNFHYRGNRGQGLKYKNWYDKGKGAGTFLKERFHGDIANA
jgi:hypothetical protein